MFYAEHFRMHFSPNNIAEKFIEHTYCCAVHLIIFSFGFTITIEKILILLSFPQDQQLAEYNQA